MKYLDRLEALSLNVFDQMAVCGGGGYVSVLKECPDCNGLGKIWTCEKEGRRIEHLAKDKCPRPSEWPCTNIRCQFGLIVKHGTLLPWCSKHLCHMDNVDGVCGMAWWAVNAKKEIAGECKPSLVWMAEVE